MSYQRDYEKRLRIGLVGAGLHAYRNLLPTLTFLPVQLQAICDINESLAKKTAAQYGVKHVFTKTQDLYKQIPLDAVIIAVSPQLHPELSIEAFSAGLHVFMEKPPAATATQVKQMIQARGNQKAVVGFKKVFMPATKKVIEIFRSNRYGRLETILGQYPVKIPGQGKEILLQGTPNDWLNNGCHPLSLMLAVGGEIESVMTYLNQDEPALCVLCFKNRVVGNFHPTGKRIVGQPTERYTFYGERCEAVIENSRRVTLLRDIPFSYINTADFTAAGEDSGAIVWESQNTLASLENKAEMTQGFYHELKYFCDCVLENKIPTLGSLEFSYQLMKVYEASLLSRGEKIAIEN